MQVIQPRNLSNTELITQCANYMDTVNEMPTAFQIELLRRFTAEASSYDLRHRDPKQLDLFLDAK